MGIPAYCIELLGPTRSFNSVSRSLMALAGFLIGTRADWRLCWGKTRHARGLCGTQERTKSV
jgi:hypothetical protein